MRLTLLAILLLLLCLPGCSRQAEDMDEVLSWMGRAGVDQWEASDAQIIAEIERLNGQHFMTDGGTSTLELAIIFGRVDVVEYLLDAGPPEVAEPPADWAYALPLVAAVECRQPFIACMLWERGATVNRRCPKRGKTAAELGFLGCDGGGKWVTGTP